MVYASWDLHDYAPSTPIDIPAPDYSPHAEPEQTAHPDAPMLLDEGPASPPYAPLATVDEWSLPASAPADGPAPHEAEGDDDVGRWDAEQSYCYGGSSSMLAVSLGPRQWGLRHPAYGALADVAGVVRLGKRLTHVTRVTVSLIGKANISATIRATSAVANQQEITVLQQVTEIPNPSPGAFFPPGASFPFRLRFPADVAAPAGGRAPPPPSFSTWSPGITADIVYYLRIDAVRKGLRRHEERRVPLHFLPKSWPTHAPPRARAAAGLGALKTVRLRHAWPEGACPLLAARADAPLVLVSLPAGASVAAGHTLLVRVTIRAPGAPALAALLARGVSVRLTRRARVWLGGTPGAMREVVLGTGVELDVDTAREGTAAVQLALPVGDGGREQSWSLPGVLEVLYHLRVSVKAPSDAGAGTFLPVYAHDERVHVATEAHGTRQRESLSLGGISAPALGMLDRRMDRSTSVAW